MDPLDGLPATLKSGNERLLFRDKELNYSLIDFWRWSVSDILSNATRGRFAEFIVGTAVGIDLQQVRDEWGAYDLETPDGIKIEVKSSSYVQSWLQKAFSKINFSIKESRQWNAETNVWADTFSRCADVYVFCLLKHQDKKTCNPLDLEQWEFYVVQTSRINSYTRSKHTITLNSLSKLTKPVCYDKLNEEIRFKYNQDHLVKE